MKRALALLLGMAFLLCAMGGAAEGMENFEFADKIPDEYLRTVDEGGTVEKFSYPARDYFGDGAEVTKHAYIYLPPDYSEDRVYDLLILCHGIGGSEGEWTFGNNWSIGRNVIDHLITEGVIPPMLIVMPNGRATANYEDTSMNNAGSFYLFGKELRNDLLPYLDAHYATYGSRTPDDLSASRNHRAMAGLSMGGMQTINIGLCECLDLFSAFGAFSSAPTSNTDKMIAARLEAFPDMPIRYFYAICGTEDTMVYAAAAQAAKDLPASTDRLNESNFHWQERKGGHDFNIWNLGLYNFARVLGAVHEE